MGALAGPALRRELLSRRQDLFDSYWRKKAGELAHAVRGYVGLATGNKRVTRGRVKAVDGIAIEVDAEHTLSLARG